jgi:hypothetical protein
MIKMRARERACAVARFTARGRLWVIHALTERDLAVVATHTRLRNACVIKMGDLPLLCGVTRVAGGVGHHMGSCLATRTYIIVATGAFARGALENAALMARLAARGQMGTCQRETRREVIKLRLGRNWRDCTYGKECR